VITKHAPRMAAAACALASAGGDVAAPSPASGISPSSRNAPARSASMEPMGAGSSFCPKGCSPEPFASGVAWTPATCLPVALVLSPECQ
jgi:hypothetical protein